MAERLSKFIREFVKPKETIKQNSLEFGSAMLANTEHPDHTEDRVVVKTLAGGSMAFIAAIDGVGSGGRDSETAAEIVQKKFDQLDQMFPDNLTLTQSTQTIGTLLLESASQLRLAQQEKNNKRMDATVAAGLIFSPRESKKRILVTANVGDSRIYRLNREAGVLTQITKDDTLVQALVDHNLLTKEAAFTDPRRNQITKAMSTVTEMQDISFTMEELNPNDIIVAVTDGLTDNIPPNDLLQRIYESIHCSASEDNNEQWNSAAKHLAGFARQVQMEKKHPFAKNDDISVIIIHLNHR